MKGKKQLILDTALELIAEHGINHTTVQMVLEGSGISKGTFYKYFHSKDDILKCLLVKHQQDEYMLRQELAEGNYDSDFDLLVDQLVVPMTLPSRVHLSGMFWTNVNTDVLNLTDFINFQIKWLAGRFVDVFGEGKRPFSTEAALLYVGMVQQVGILWRRLYGTKTDWKTVVPKILRYIEAILTAMEEAGEGILNVHALSDEQMPGGEIAVDIGEVREMLKHFLDSLKGREIPEEAIRYAEGLNMLVSDNELNQPMLELTLPAFKRAFNDTEAEGEAHHIFLLCKLYMGTNCWATKDFPEKRTYP